MVEMTFSRHPKVDSPSTTVETVKRGRLVVAAWTVFLLLSAFVAETVKRGKLVVAAWTVFLLLSISLCGRDSEKKQAGGRCWTVFLLLSVDPCRRNSETRQAGSRCLDCVPVAVSRPLWHQSKYPPCPPPPPTPYLPSLTHPNLCGRMGKRRGGDEGSGADGVPYGP